MPPFRLELPDRRHERTNWRMLHTKKLFNLPVKVEDWDQARDTKPFDNDPLCPGSVNLFKSHYSNLGFQENQPYITETMDMLGQLSCPSIPHLKYRRLKSERSELSPFKFYDEGFSDQTVMLQQFKSDRFKSYNPGTGLYSDGSMVQETQRKLFKLEYKKDDD